MASTKKLLLVAVAAAVMLVAIAAPAFAGGYLAWTQVSALPGQGTSPHGGYTASTVKCQVCHAVHYANATGELLLNSTVASACNYCHVGGAGGYTQVYNGQPSNYQGTDYATAHNAGIVNGVTCTECHQVHAAQNVMTANAALTSKLLRLRTPVDVVAGAPQSGEPTYVAMSKWCADCHYNRGLNGQAVGASSSVSYYYNQARNGRSHVMTAAGATYTNPAATTTTKVAWSGSTVCMECHAAGTPVVEGFTTNAQSATYNFPHYTQNAANFLESAEASNRPRSGAATNDADGVCLTCHRNWTGAVTQGIGFTY